jgi:predicted PurR-regulated permease PerM
MENYFNGIKRLLQNRKVRKTIALIIGLVVILWFVGLFRTPTNYRIIRPPDDAYASQYLTNYILPQLLNKSQYNQPFELVISETGINDIIVRHVDANSLRQSNLSNLSVAFTKSRVLLTGKTVYCGLDFIVTIILKPYISREGYFFLKVPEIQAGRSRIPFIVETVKRKILQELADFLNGLDIADSTRALFNSRRIEPVFSLNHRKLRIDKITVQNKELLIHFLPQQDK